MGRTKALLIAIIMAAMLFLAQGCYWGHHHDDRDWDHWDHNDRRGHHP